MNKTEHIHLRISPKDKQAVSELAEDMQMSISEYIVYLIRREHEKKTLKNEDE